MESSQDLENYKEEEVYTIFWNDCVGDDDFYTNEGMLSPDMLVLFIEVNYEDYFDYDCRVREIAELVAFQVNRNKVI